ncbi:MAG: sigma-54-dependent Fis family transcriptional regulator [Spirochaetales bacterium]|nr:sigma-54-dependent Fis family transcriptional regulator [Spirochaetales bacterium]
MDILVVDDARDIISSIRKVLPEFRVMGAVAFSQVKNILNRDNGINIILIDLKLGNEDGIEVLKYVKAKYPLIECIMISGYSTIEKAVQAIKLGAYDFLEKPLSFQKVKITINNALEHRNYLRLLNEHALRYRLLGKSDKIQRVKNLIDKASVTDFPVLISGESGSGKEHVANLIHLKSSRSQKEMIAVNCAAIPESLFESELFGHEKGAFTDAGRRRIGKIEQADGSSLFLDEIGDMPLPQQAKLLRVMENGEFSRLGSEDKLRTEFRLISASNRDLETLINEDLFRTDLFYRISSLIIHVPPLRERREDIPEIAEYFLKNIFLEYGGKEKHLNREALKKISSLPFKGNVRELKNLIQQLYIISENEEITAGDIAQTARNSITIASAPDNIFKKTLPYKEAKNMLEREYILKQLEIHNYNISRTAVSLGILPNNLMRKMKTLNITIQ